MGRADDKEGEALLSEADDEKDKDYSDKDTSDVDDANVECKKKYKCTEPGCTARFLRPSRLTWHLRKHNDERPYKCSIEGCTRAYTNSSHLKRHENTHKPITKTYTCKECLLEVGSLFSLKRHRRMIHDPKRLTCADCGAKFRKKHCYNEHLSMHAGISMYKCNVCQLEFPTLRLMKRHQLIHDKQKSYPCKSSGCTQVFDKWSKLVKHVETEHQFDHKCDKCDKMFKLKCHLVSHKVVHINDNILIPCPYLNCPRFYVRQRNLDDHVETFHQGRRFYCDTCNAAVTSKASIIRHIKSFHELPKKSPKKTNKPRRRRKDAGLQKISMAMKLTGMKVSHNLEKCILNRQPRIVLEQFTENPLSFESKKKEKNSDAKSSSLITVTRDNEEKNVKKQLLEQTEEEIMCSADDLLLSGRLIVFDNNAEVSILPDRLTPNENLVLEKDLEKCFNVPDDDNDTSISTEDLIPTDKLDILDKCFPDTSTKLMTLDLSSNYEDIIAEELLEKSSDTSEIQSKLE